MEAGTVLAGGASGWASDLDDDDLLERLIREAEEEDGLDDEDDLPQLLDLFRPVADGEAAAH